MEVLRGSLHRIVRVLQAAQRWGPRPAPLASKWILEPERSHQFREGARDGDVVLRHARRHRGLLCVHRGVAEHKRPS